MLDNYYFEINIIIINKYEKINFLFLGFKNIFVNLMMKKIYFFYYPF